MAVILDYHLPGPSLSWLNTDGGGAVSGPAVMTARNMPQLHTLFAGVGFKKQQAAGDDTWCLGGTRKPSYILHVHTLSSLSSPAWSRCVKERAQVL